jgi:hypothetical protein
VASAGRRLAADTPAITDGRDGVERRFERREALEQLSLPGAAVGCQTSPVTDWTSAAAEIATAAGTLILAGATFSSVRSAQRATRATEAALLAGIRPVLVASRLEDATQKISFIDDHWVHLRGGRAVAEVADDAIYLVMSLRNVGNGLAVLDRWDLAPDRVLTERSSEDVETFRRLSRDIYVPAGDLGFWQGALRDPTEPLFDATRKAIAERSMITVDLLYGDHDGGQRTITRFAYRPVGETDWLATVTRHWNLDRPNPR